ncbi:hypothetical protein LPJ61_001090 [Coemansia biformis]|uniref:LITAF domain-containing protein n=1 Tax=Coemansia biformis TaxID=1286918 RepID=A0A9W8CZX2_9FUNG|nr:hypothetical protein LPJ61_001090 [Coemansia biformis]
MASRLEKPITDSAGSLAEHGHGRHGGPSGSQLDPPPYLDGPQRAPGPSTHSGPYHADGGMQNLMEPPDDRDVYPQAPPVGPDAASHLGRRPQTVECPWCHAVVTTRVRRQLGLKSGGAAVVVAIIAWPLFWVPLVVPGLHRKIHYCPQCQRKIGRGHRKPRAAPSSSTHP